MKPIKLIISAFGPYAGVTPEINFEKFEERGLFLIPDPEKPQYLMPFVLHCTGQPAEHTGIQRICAVSMQRTRIKAM